MGASISAASSAAPGALLAVLELIADAAVLVTRDGRIVGANGSARAALGLDARDAVLLPDLTVEPDATRTFLRLCARTTQPIPGALRFAKAGTAAHAAVGALVAPPTDGQASTIAIRFWPRDQGNPFIVLTQKIAELNEEVKRRREAEEALRASEARLREHARELEAASVVKDQFLATVSHELRTPLNAILGWSVMLRSGRLDEPTRDRALVTIERNARAQAQIVDDLLDVSRIVTGQVRLEVHQLQPIAVVEAALETVRPGADAKKIRLQAVLDPGAGPVIGDAARIQQVLWNVLSNAVKFTPKGGRIQVVLRSVDSAIEIEVSDTGAGIGAEFLPYVFTRFRQEDSSTTRRHGGLGLGLSIAKNLVELHGGTIEAFSEGTDRGTRMVVRLPRAPMRLPPPPAGRLSAAEPARDVESPFACPDEIPGLRLLIVDDDPDSLGMVSSFFERCGATVATAASGAEALALVTAMRPDVLISDVGMPEMDGHELIRRVRALDRELGGAAPAVALTAYARSDDRTAALSAGFDAHVAKPVEPRELLAVVAGLVRRR
jgi:signal transduction histidine kinase